MTNPRRVLDVSRRGKAEIDEWLLEARCAQRTNFLATEILLVGHHSSGLFRELEARGQLRLVGIVGCVIEGAPFDVVSDATGRPGGATTVEMMEAPILREQREIGGRALEVVVVLFMNNTCVGAAISRITTFVMMPAVTQTPEHRVEEIAVAHVGAASSGVAGHDSSSCTWST